MEVLHLVRLICKLMGLKLIEHKLLKIINFLINSIFILIIGFFFIPIFAYFVENIDDMTAVTDASHVAVASILCFGQYMFFVFQQNKLESIFDDLQYIVDMSMN